MFKRLLTFLFLASPLLAQTPVIVTGTVTDAGNNPATSGYVQFDVIPKASGIHYFVSGVGTITQTTQCGINSSGSVKNLALTGNCTVWGNDVISPANTQYKVTFAPGGNVTNIVSGECITGVTYSLNNPVFCPIVQVSPQQVIVRSNPFQTNILPIATNVFNIGSPSLQYANIYASSVFQNGSAVPCSACNNAFTGGNTFIGNAAFKSGIPWVDVLAYGAVGDDLADDTTAIQAAIDAAAGASCVRFNGKTYRTTAALTLASAPCLVGDGSERTIIHNSSTSCFSKKPSVTSVFDAYISGIACRDNNTGASTTAGFDFTEFNRSHLQDLDVWYKLIGYQWKRNSGGNGNFYNKGFHLKANDTKFCMSLDSTFSINENAFYATECRRLAGTWDAGGGEVGVSISGVGNRFFGLYVSASGATSTAVKFQGSPAPNSHNAIYGLYTESLPTQDLDLTGVAGPVYVDGLISDGRTSPIILDPNENLTLRSDAASVTVDGVAGQPSLHWARQENANGAGTGMRLGYSTFYPPSSAADPTSPTPLAGAVNYRSDLARLRWFDTAWHSIPGLDTANVFTQTMDLKRVRASQGTALVIGDFALTGWGSAPAPTITVAGSDAAYFLEITAGGTPSANPTAVHTFKDGTWTLVPVCQTTRTNGTAPTGNLWEISAQSATSITLLFRGTPVASTAYGVNVVCIGK